MLRRIVESLRPVGPRAFLDGARRELLAATAAVAGGVRVLAEQYHLRRPRRGPLFLMNSVDRGVNFLSFIPVLAMEETWKTTDV